MASYDKSDYITLADASEQSPYSQEYLSLRARQGKLRALKRGRTWYTTGGWLDDYLEQVNEARNELKTMQVIAPVSSSTDNDMSSVNDPVSDLKRYDHFQPANDEGFTFHPHAVKKNGKFGARPQSESIINDQTVPTGQNFSWEDEPAKVNLSQERELLMANLRDRVDRAIDQSSPVIELADSQSDNSSRTITPRQLGNGFVELGMSEVENRLKDQPNNLTLAADGPSSQELPPLSIRPNLSFSLPRVAMAMFLVLLISMGILFDHLFQVRQYASIGFGLTVHNIGQQLIAIGQDQQDRKLNRLVQLPQQTSLISQAILPDKVEASELFDQVGGKVAGVTDSSIEVGFWPTVYKGIKIVFSLP